MKKKVQEEVPAVAKRYANEFIEEINADCSIHGKKPFDNDDDNKPSATDKKKYNNISKKKLARLTLNP